MMPSHEQALVNVMRSFEGNWWVAGGWAIDLFLERQTREHADLDIAIRRSDQKKLLSLPDVLEAHYVADNALHRWHGETLELPIHEIRLMLRSGSELEILLNEFSEDRWIYRRDKRITLQLARFPKADIPFLPPEIVLLYKSKNPLEKDETDFENAQVSIHAHQKLWLENALIQVNASRAWIALLRSQ